MSYQAKNPEQYRIIFHQDAVGPLRCADGAEITPELLREYSVRQFEHLPVDVYACCANHASGVDYRSKVAPWKLSTPGHFRGQVDVRVMDRLQALAAAGTDPQEIYCEAAHEAGIDYMARLRMNDLHDAVGIALGVDKPNHRPTDSTGHVVFYTNQWKLDHPEYLIGDPGDDTPVNSFNFYQRCAMNYALGPVREHIFDMAAELATGYDLDILELDFIRFTFCFHQSEAWAQRHVLTGLVRRIRELCDSQGQSRGRPLRLSARVPDTLELGLRAGIDTETWLAEGLLDMISIGGGYSEFGTPWEEITDLARAAGVPAFACLNRVGVASRRNIPRIRAAARRAHAAGVTGLKLWNFFYHLPYYNPPDAADANVDFFADLADPATLPQKELTYSADPCLDPDSLVGPAHFHNAWSGQLPMTIGLSRDGIGQTVTFDIPDECAGRRPDDRAKLSLLVSNFWVHDDRLELRWNGQPVDDVDYELRRTSEAEMYLLTCPVGCGSIKAGENALEIRLVERDPRLDPFIALREADLTIPEAGA